MNSINKFDFLKFDVYPNSYINAIEVTWEQYKTIKNQCRQDCVTFIDSKDSDYFKVEEDFNDVYWYGVIKSVSAVKDPTDYSNTYEKIKLLHISQQVLYELVRYGVKNDIFDSEQTQGEICDIYYQMRDDMMKQIKTRYVVEVHDSYNEPTGIDCVEFFMNKCEI